MLNRAQYPAHVFQRHSQHARHVYCLATPHWNSIGAYFIFPRLGTLIQSCPSLLPPSIVLIVLNLAQYPARVFQRHSRHARHIYCLATRCWNSIGAYFIFPRLCTLIQSRPSLLPPSIVLHMYFNVTPDMPDTFIV